MRLSKYIFILIIFLGGCTNLRFAALREEITAGKFSGVYIPVPFVKQENYWCGPAALSAVLAYWGKDVPQKDIAAAIYRLSIRAALTVELEAYPARLNLFADARALDFEMLKERLRQGKPVIALCKNPLLARSKFHYLVLIGFDDSAQVVIAHTGTHANTPIPYSTFRKRWEKAGCWGLIVAPAQKVNWPLGAEKKIMLGLLLEKEGNLAKAAAILKEVMEKKPDHAIAPFNLANIYLKQGNLNAAEECYKTALANDPDFADAYNNLAWVYVEMGENLAEAEELVKKALSLSVDKTPDVMSGSLRPPDNYARYMDTRGGIYLKRGMPAEAATAFKNALTRCKDLAEKKEIYLHLGKAYEALGDNAQALKYYGKAKQE